MKQIKLLILLLLLAVSCSDGVNEPSETELPQITFSSSTNSYVVIQGEEIIITPAYANVSGALYVWRRDGSVVSEESSLTFSNDEMGDYYFELEVTNCVGSSYKELLISVVSASSLSVELAAVGEAHSVVRGALFTIKSLVGEGDSYQYEWSLDGTTIASTQDLSYTIDQEGEYDLTLNVYGEDGSGSASTALKVVEEEDMPLYWDFERVEYNLASGREVRVKCWNVTNDFGGDFVWQLNGAEVQRCESAEYIFAESTQGEYQLMVTKYNTKDEESATQSFTLNVSPAEGTYKRAITAASSSSSDKVYEFSPAPGQFINYGYSATTPSEAATYAEERLSVGGYVSLGSFGGYIVVGFDHSVENSGGYDISILGNPMTTSNEPGIVMVMQDENGDGEPNDTWYELKGSETESGSEISDFAITYFRPSNGDQSSSSYYFTTNDGGDGTITKSYNYQDYWPAWITDDVMRFYGTTLSARNEEITPDYWVNGSYDWGYADNMSSVDMQESGSLKNHFKISDAIDYKGDAVQLDYIDFVKVYSAVVAQSGSLGELSTEILHIEDCNISD